tara:strand:+ start:644 stop:2059 length:1416 start_codon:yes stop_codon:yes gene_type:complete
MSQGSGRSRNDRTGPKPPTPAELQAQQQDASRTQQYEDALAAGTVDMVRKGRSNAGQPQPISEEQFTAQRVADMQGAAMTRNPDNEFGYIDPDARRFDAGFQAKQRDIRDDYGVQQGEFSDARVSNIIDPEQNYIVANEKRAALEGGGDVPIDDSTGGMGGTPTDPFSSGLTELQTERKGMYEDMFANQETFAQDKYDSITEYLGTLDTERQDQYKADLANIGQMYNERKEQRDNRFTQALSGAGNRESLALDTLADLGITPDRNTFDSVTGSTKDMLFSQQQSGADMLNTMSYISNQMLEFSNTATGRSISAGLQQAEMGLAEEMANIQFARDSQAISDIEAAIAQEKATASANAALARAEKARQREDDLYATAGAYFGIEDRAEAIALMRTGAGDAVINSIMNPGAAPETTLMVPTTEYGNVPMNINQAISSGFLKQGPAGFWETDEGYLIPIDSPGDVQTQREADALR